MMCCEYAPFCLEDSGRYDCHISFNSTDLKLAKRWNREVPWFPVAQPSSSLGVVSSISEHAEQVFAQDRAVKSCRGNFFFQYQMMPASPHKSRFFKELQYVTLLLCTSNPTIWFPWFWASRSYWSWKCSWFRGIRCGTSFRWSPCDHTQHCQRNRETDCHPPLLGQVCRFGGSLRKMQEQSYHQDSLWSCKTWGGR